MFKNPFNIDLIALDSVIESYDYDNDPVLREGFRSIEDSLWSCIEHYAEGVNDFGRQMADHLRRTSVDGAKFLKEELGFSEKAAANFHAANLFQDLGKIHPDYDPHLWDLPHRPTEEEREEKRKHPARGVEILEVALENAAPEVRDHPHVKTLIPAIQMFHHERADGSGLYGKKSADTGLVIKTVCLVDAKDGDMIQRGHQNHVREEKEALLRMKSLPEYDKDGKYAGAFDDLLDRYIKYRERVTGTVILPETDPVQA